MADGKSQRRAFMEISSSSSSSSSEESEYSPDSCADDDYDDDDASNWSYSENEDDEEEEGHADKGDEASTCNKIIRFLQGRGDLQELKLVECKVYLRRHGLRLSGKKEECIERIKEHWRLKDGDGEALYPRSSFTINCTGDVCKGDVVLFNQRVYESFNKMRRHGNVLGKRTVVGRIVKESYGVAKQQHTFTVEVLWSKGTKKLAPLSPLLIKGRNLYKMKTFRQHWKNERERSNVLAEKHMRGAAARSIRAMRRTKMEMKTNKSLANEGNKCKHFDKLHPSGTKETNHVNKSRANEQRETVSRNKKHYPSQNFPPLQELNPKHTKDFRHPASHLRHQNLKLSNQVSKPFHQNNNHCQDSYYTFNRRSHNFPVNPHRDCHLTRANEQRETGSRNKKHNPSQNIPPLQELDSKHTTDFRHPTSYLRHQNLKQSNQASEPFHQNNNHCQDSYYTFNRRPHHFPVNPHRDYHLTPFSESREFNQASLMHNAYPHFTQVPESRRFDPVLG